MKNIFKGICLCLVVLFVLFIVGCSSKAQMNSSNSVMDKAKDEAISGSIAFSNEKADTSATSANSNALVGRKIIKNADLQLETLQFNACVNSFEGLVTTLGGFIQNSDINSNGSNVNEQTMKRATYTVRIPTNKLDEFLGRIGEIGTVVSKKITGQDVTQEYFDVESRVKSLRIEEERLLAIKARASSLGEILELEKRMTEVRNSIEQLTGQLQKMDALVDLATVHLTINEVKKLEEKTPESFFSKIGFMFNSSIGALGEVLMGFTLVIVAIFPFVFILMLIGFIVFLIYKKVKKSK